MNSTSIKVAIVEDDSRVRESLSVLVGGAPGFVLADAYPNAEAALKGIPENWPDVVLMDIGLPRMSGIECVGRLKNLKPDLQFVMLTAYDEDDLIFQSLMAGASGYLIKQTPPSEILDALSDLQKGGSPMSNSIARKVVQYFQKKPAASDAGSITTREREILTHLSKGYQDKEIAAQLGVSVLTVRTHIRNIYEKLHVHSRTEAVMKFLGR